MDSIVRYVKSENEATFDEQEIYIEDSKEHLRALLETEKICGLCKQTCNLSFSVANDSSTKEPVLCSSCVDALNTERYSDYEKVEGPFNVKIEDIEMKSGEDEAATMDTEHSTFSYVKPENEIPLDQPDIYLEESKEHLKTVLEDEKICELCKCICTHGFTPVKDLKGDVTCDLALPEVDFNSNIEPVVCLSCLNSLNIHRHSLDIGSDVQSDITNTFEQKSPFHIKTEEVDIKCEHDEIRTTAGWYKEPCGSQTSQATHKNIPLHHQPTQEDNSKTQKYQCCSCSYNTKYKNNLERHQIKHKNIFDVQMYNCDTCSFGTRHKYALDRHQLKHKNVSEVQMYKCNTCNFETKYKNSLTKHKLIHKDVSETQMYKCDTCSFETKHKPALAHHQLKHKSASEVRMYKCVSCAFATKHRHSLTEHLLMHRDNSELRMHKCGLCTFETYRKRNLHRHQLKHKNNSEVQMYKCDTCNYETKYKEYIASHRLLHKKVSEVEMYNCHECSYTSRFKRALAMHVLTHKGVFGGTKVPTQYIPFPN